MTLPAYLKIPALLIRIVIPPNASSAVWMTAAPSVTEDVFAAALPPAKTGYESTFTIMDHIRLTFFNLINNLLGILLANIVHNHIRSSRRKRQRIPIHEAPMSSPHPKS